MRMVRPEPKKVRGVPVEDAGVTWVEERPPQERKRR